MWLTWTQTYTERGKLYTEISRPKDVNTTYCVYRYPHHVSVMGTLGMEEWPQKWVEPGGVGEQIEAAKEFCERDYLLRLRRKRWQEYMDAHDPPEIDEPPHCQSCNQILTVASGTHVCGPWV